MFFRYAHRCIITHHRGRDGEKNRALSTKSSGNTCAMSPRWSLLEVPGSLGALPPPGAVPGSPLALLDMGVHDGELPGQGLLLPEWCVAGIKGTFVV